MAGTINVACKLPSGLILETGKPVMEDGKPKMDPSRHCVMMEDVQQTRIFGPLFKSNPDTDPEAFGGVVAGFAITKGVDADRFENWIAMHSYIPFVRDGSLFAMKDTRSLTDKAKDNRHVLTGLEPLAERDSRVPEAMSLLTKGDRSGSN